MATLERAVLGVRRSSIPEQRLDPHDELLKHIYAEAKQKLGYQGPQPTPPVPNLLADTLKKLEIKPLNRRAVKRYKAYMAHRPSPERAVAARLVFVLAALTISTGHLVVVGGPAWLWLCVPSGIATFITLVSLSFLDHARWSWESYWLSHYGKIVPEMALTNALRIKDALPGVEFQVEELKYRSEPIPRDPFLVATYGNERYYIDVWDEPKFRP